MKIFVEGKTDRVFLELYFKYLKINIKELNIIIIEGKDNLANEKQLEKMTLNFKVKVGKGDQVFGSVSSKQIKEELEKKNIIIDKKQIMLENGLASLGYHDVKIELYKDIIGVVKVKLEK